MGLLFVYVLYVEICSDCCQWMLVRHGEYLGLDASAIWASSDFIEHFIQNYIGLKLA